MVNPKDRYITVGEFGDAMTLALSAKRRTRQTAQHYRSGLRGKIVSINSGVPKGAFPELLLDVALGKRPVADLMLHRKFGVLLLEVR